MEIKKAKAEHNRPIPYKKESLNTAIGGAVAVLFGLWKSNLMQNVSNPLFLVFYPIGIACLIGAAAFYISGISERTILERIDELEKRIA